MKNILYFIVGISIISWRNIVQTVFLGFWYKDKCTVCHKNIEDCEHYTKITNFYGISVYICKDCASVVNVVSTEDNKVEKSARVIAKIG